MQSVATITVAALRNCRHNGREEGATQGFCRTVRGGPGLAGGELMARRSVSRRQSHLRRRNATRHTRDRDQIDFADNQRRQTDLLTARATRSSIT